MNPKKISFSFIHFEIIPLLLAALILSSANISYCAEASANITQVNQTQTLPLDTAQLNLANAPVAPDEQLSDQEIMDEKLNKKISLDLRDMNIIDVIKFLAVKGDFNVVTSKDIQGRATLLLHDVAIRDALQIIMISNDLAYTQKNLIIYVMSGAEYLSAYGKKFNDNTKVKIVYLKYARPAYVLTALQNIRSNVGKIVIDEDTGTVVMIDTEEKLAEMENAIDQLEYRTETKVITLVYAKAETVASQLKSRLDAKAVGTIQFDERSNQVIITALPERMLEIEALVKALDTKTKVVLLEATILQVTLNPSYEMGINWQVAFQTSANKLLRTLNFTGAFPYSSTASASGGQIAVGELGTNDFTTAIKMLKQVKTTKLLANPRIMAANNQESKIHIGDTEPYVTTTTTGSGDTATSSETVNWINVGIQLLVTPTIMENGFVLIKIKPEISSKISDYITPKGAKIPVVNTTLVETTVLAKDGSTVIIGGLVKNDKLTQKQGIPGLMSLPLIGGLFKNDSDSVTNSEIVIFITPHIVTGETELGEYHQNIIPMKDYQAANETAE